MDIRNFLVFCGILLISVDCSTAIALQDSSAEGAGTVLPMEVFLEMSVPKSDRQVEDNKLKQLSREDLIRLVQDLKQEIRSELLNYVVNSPEVIKDLGIVNYQLEVFKASKNKLEAEIDSLRDDLKNQRERAEDDAVLSKLKGDFLKKVKIAIDSNFESVEEHLLPHQQKYLNLIVGKAALARLKSSTAGRAKWPNVVASFLELSDEETEKVGLVFLEAKKGLEETTQKANKAAVRTVLNVLPSEKQEFLKDLLGDDFREYSLLFSK